MRLFTYKLVSDTGFAPNPFGETLTLATCKPQIRHCKGKGDWIAGFTSVSLTGDPVGEERLIYLMQVAEKLHIGEYFQDSRFQTKIPDMTAKGPEAKAGDNIYRPCVVGAFEGEHFEQLPNPNHWGDNMPSQDDLERDISGQYVLVAGEYYYFGRDALAIPPELRPAVPRAQSAHGALTEEAQAHRFIEFVRSQCKPGRNGAPHTWPDELTENRTSCGEYK
jgi:hypothetical protein